MKPYAIFSGEVTRVEDLTSKSGKRFIAVTLEGSAVQYGEKTWRPRVDVVCWRNHEELLKLRMGTWVMATGEIEARAYESKGKCYAALRMTGEVAPLITGAIKVPAPTPTPAPAAPAAPAPAPDEDDDVPF